MIFHAQFETIHPFTDSNGRTGRALLYRMLSRDEILLHAALPISAGLLHGVEDYMQAFAACRDGEIEPIVEYVASALELAVVIGARVSPDVDFLFFGDEGTRRLPYDIREGHMVGNGKIFNCFFLYFGKPNSVWLLKCY